MWRQLATAGRKLKIRRTATPIIWLKIAEFLTKCSRLSPCSNCSALTASTVNMLGKGMKKASVLIIEDEPLLSEFLVTLVEDAGADAVAVDTVHQGIDLLECQPWALVITDVKTPGAFDGWDLAWTANDLLPELMVVVTSGGNAKLNTPLPSSAIFLPKPWPLDRMMLLLETRLKCTSA